MIAVCFAIELALAQPQPIDILRGMKPEADVLRDPRMLYVTIGILGATVMPHNLYLHSAMVKSRRFSRDDADLRQALRFARIDVVVALAFAIFINAAILVLAAASFHRQGLTDIGIEDAYRLLSPTLGAGPASVLFAIALLAAGQNSSITGTLARTDCDGRLHGPSVAAVAASPGVAAGCHGARYGGGGSLW